MQVMPTSSACEIFEELTTNHSLKITSTTTTTVKEQSLTKLVGQNTDLHAIKFIRLQAVSAGLLMLEIIFPKQAAAVAETSTT